MVAKVKKQEIEFGNNSTGVTEIKLAKAFKLKADIRVMKEMKNVAMNIVVEKLGDISDTDKYIEQDLGNGVFITITPPYTSQRFDAKVYTEWLELNGLLDSACQKFIYRETNEIRETLRFASEYIAGIDGKTYNFKSRIINVKLPELAEVCTELSVEIKKLEVEYKNTIDQVLFDETGIVREDLFNKKYIYNDGDIKGTLSFSRSVKKSFDLNRVGEMLPDSLSEDEKNAILKSRTVVIISPVVSIMTAENLEKMHQYLGKNEIDDDDTDMSI